MDVAAPLIDALIEAKPDWPYFYEIKGQFLFESGKPAEAVPPLREAVKIAPNEPLIRVMFGQALIGTNNPKLVDEAITNLRTALAREDSSAMGYRMLAAAYAQKAEAAQAVGAKKQFMAQAALEIGRAHV